jgi:hypothetical protein
MKRFISTLLIITLLFSLLPVCANANESQFVDIGINHKRSNMAGIHKTISVIEAGEELLFSGEDLAMLSGFKYWIEKGSAYFTRGMKMLRVDLSTSKLYPFEDIALVGKIGFAEKVQKIDGVYYFPGSEMLPWLNVTCFMLDGILNVHPDDVSIWEIIPQFAPEEFAFDFTACCKELGENGKYLKARAYLQDEGISGMFFDLVPVIGDYLDYYDLFEDALQDQSAAEEEMNDLLDNAEDVDYWMGIAEDYEVIEDLPDEIRVFGKAAKILANNSVSFIFELGTYVKYFYLHDENILSALFSMELNSNLYGLPDSATTALVGIREHYADYYAGIEHKMMVAIGETALDGLTDTATGLYKVAVTLLGFAEATSPDWAEGINRISSYDVISEYCLSGYKDMIDQTWMSSVRDLRSLAYMYLYACEQNWTAMANYAEKEGKLDLKAKYEANAEAAEEWQRTFMRTTPAEQNDSHEYGEANGGMKQEYTDKLKKMFAAISRSQSADAILLDETCWIWSRGITADSSYAVLFHADGSLDYCNVNNGTSGTTTYQYKNSILSIDSIDYIWQENHFVSTEKLEVSGSDKAESLYLYPDEYGRYYQLVPSYNVENLAEELQTRYGTASYTEFISYFADYLYTYPESISGFLNETPVDLNLDGENERLVLLADSKQMAVILQVYRKSGDKYVLSCQENIAELEYCAQQNVALFYNEAAGGYLLFVDKNTAGAYTGNDIKDATIFDVECTRINLVCHASVDDHGIATDDIYGQLQALGVPYAKNCAEISNITSQSQYKELLEIRHRYFNIDPMGGLVGQEHHLQLLTPENRDKLVEPVQTWTITKRNSGYISPYQETTYTVEWKSGQVYTLLPEWIDGENVGYGIIEYEVDTQKRTIMILMDYPEGCKNWESLVIDLVNNTYYGQGFNVYGEDAPDSESSGFSKYIGRDISDIVNELGSNYIDTYLDGGHCYGFTDYNVYFFFENPDSTETRVFFVLSYGNANLGYGLSGNMTYSEIVEVLSAYDDVKLDKPTSNYNVMDDCYEYSLSFTLKGLNYTFSWNEDPETHQSYEAYISY